MQNNSDLLKKMKIILREVRFGNFSNRLLPKDYTSNIEFINDFNNMLDSLQDRENMLKENQNISFAKTEQLKSLFNMLNEGAMTIDKNLKILSVNTIQAKWFRKNKKEIVGSSLYDILKNYAITNSDNKPIKDYSKFLEEEKRNYILNFEFKKIKIHFSISIKTFTNKKGEENYFIISKDITSDVKLQKLKDTFIATLTHDLKVPIIAEEKVLTMLLNEQLKTKVEQKEAFHNMLSNNSDMMTLVTTLLDVYKIEEGVFKINKSSFKIQDTIKSEIEKLKFLLSENQLKIKFTNKATIDDIVADGKEISRVIRNILTNAIDFTPINNVISVEINNDKNDLFINISNPGAGIDKKDLPHIFDRYFSSGKKYRKVGTGLGLYLSKKIILLHNGDITTTSIPNKKTTFCIKLPIKNHQN